MSCEGSVFFTTITVSRNELFDLYFYQKVDITFHITQDKMKDARSEVVNAITEMVRGLSEVAQTRSK